MVIVGAAVPIPGKIKVVVVEIGRLLLSHFHFTHSTTLKSYYLLPARRYLRRRDPHLAPRRRRHRPPPPHHRKPQARNMARA